MNVAPDPSDCGARSGCRFPRAEFCAAWRPALVLACVVSCGREPSVPVGQEGQLTGVWVGAITYGGMFVSVTAWLEQEGTRVVGVVDVGRAPELPAPSDAPCQELTRSADGTISHRVATGLGADAIFVVSFDGSSESLVGEWAAATELANEGGDLAPRRVAWLPDQLQCIA